MIYNKGSLQFQRGGLMLYTCVDFFHFTKTRALDTFSIEPKLPKQRDDFENAVQVQQQFALKNDYDRYSHPKS